MALHLLVFAAALAGLLVAARLFTRAAESIGKWLGLPPFVIGVFIIGIGTSLPELVSGMLSVQRGASEILPGNILGSNISNLLLVTGFAVAINRRNIELKSGYIAIDLHFLVGSFLVLGMVAMDGRITFVEAAFGLAIFLVYSVYLIRSGTQEDGSDKASRPRQPWSHVGLLLVSGVGIYFGADYTVGSLAEIANGLHIPKSIVALTLLSLGTTLPELVVNITAIRRGNAEMAIGNVLGSCIFNALVIPGAASTLGPITVPAELLSFSLPMMVASGILFYLLTQDKKISMWEGILLVMIYGLFLLKTAGLG